MEANMDLIEEEEFISGVIADKEDEEERQFQREQKRRRKWKLLREDEPDLELDQVSYDPDSDDDMCEDPNDLY